MERATWGVYTLLYLSPNCFLMSALDKGRIASVRFAVSIFVGIPPILTEKPLMPVFS